jgi:hypothetical protein
MGHDADHAAMLAASYIPGQDPEADRETREAEAFWRGDAEEGEIDAASMAVARAGQLQEVLQRAGHLPCSLSVTAVTSPDQHGKTCVVCGCGQFFEAPELGGVSLTPRMVDARGPAAVTVAAADPISRQLELIEPGADYAPAEIEGLMLECVRRIELGQAYERHALEEFYAARKAHHRAYLLAYQKSTGAVQTRVNAAELEALAEWEAMEDAELIHKAVKAAQHNLRSALSGYQSILRSVSATYNAGGSSGRPT